MGTIRQKQLARNIVDNAMGVRKFRTAADMLADANYSESAQLNPARTIENEGVQEELLALGFNPDAAKRVVAEILENTDEEAKDRLKAAELVFKVHGSFAPEKRVTVNVDVAERPELQEAAKVLNEHFKRQLSAGGNGDVANPLGVEAPNKE